MPGSHLTPTPLDDALLEALGEAARDVVRVDVRAGDVMMVDIRAFHQWLVLERGRREDHPDAWRIWLGMSRWVGRWLIHGGFGCESALNHFAWGWGVLCLDLAVVFRCDGTEIRLPVSRVGMNQAIDFAR